MLSQINNIQYIERNVWFTEIERGIEIFIPTETQNRMPLEVKKENKMYSLFWYVFIEIVQYLYINEKSENILRKKWLYSAVYNISMKWTQNMDLFWYWLCVWVRFSSQVNTTLGSTDTVSESEPFKAIQSAMDHFWSVLLISHSHDYCRQRDIRHSATAAAIWTATDLISKFSSRHIQYLRLHSILAPVIAIII